MPVTAGDYIFIKGVKGWHGPVLIQDALKEQKINQNGKINLEIKDDEKIDKLKDKLQIKNHNSKKYIGLLYNIEYFQNNDKFEIFQVDQKEVLELSDRTENKYALKKGIKQKKPFTILPLTPLNFYKYLIGKNLTISHSIFAYISLELIKDRKIVIFDTSDLLFSFTALYKGCKPKLFGLKNTEKMIGSHQIKLQKFVQEATNGTIKKQEIDKLSDKIYFTSTDNDFSYDSLIVVEQLDVEMLKQFIFQIEFRDKLLIYRRIRSEAEEMFK
ncbi:hypothetical protein M153_2479000812, partial [Pseudoloma neurophilia]